jgi:hypothetical protein
MGDTPMTPVLLSVGRGMICGVAKVTVPDVALVELRRALLGAGYSRAKVDGCLGFVMGERTGEGVVKSPTSRAEYRRMLACVTSPGLWAAVA